MQGPKIDKVIFWVALVVILCFSVPLVLFPSEGKAVLSTALGWTTKTLGWGYLWFTIGAFGVLLYYALGKYGNVRFGGPDARPEFSLPSWVAMLFCAGIGASVMYWGTIEWAYYYSGPPFGMEPKSKEATEWAAMYGLFHWGFTAWAVYCIPTLPLAYLYWNRKRPVLRLSAACAGVIGDRAAKGIPGKVIDILFMFGLIGGVGTSIGLGTPMLSAGLAELFGLERTFLLDVLVIAIWGAIFGFSVYSGLEKGIRVLSDINLWLIIFVLAFTFLFGPTIFILDTFTNSIGLLIQNFVEMSFYIDPVTKGQNFIAAASEGKSYVDAGGTFPEWWTIFYWRGGSRTPRSWAVRCPHFEGAHDSGADRGGNRRWIARLLDFLRDSRQHEHVLSARRHARHERHGRGRTSAGSDHCDHRGGRGSGTALRRAAPHRVRGARLHIRSNHDGLLRLYPVFGSPPKSRRNRRNRARWHRFFWAIALAVVSLSLMFAGGKDSLKALQAASVVVALPLMVVLILMTVSFMKWLKEDHPAAGETRISVASNPSGSE